MFEVGHIFERVIFRCIFLLGGLGLFGSAWTAPDVRADGLETFANFGVTGSSYVTTSFSGQDGSTWTCANCRGNKVINSPTPGMAKGTNAWIQSGTIAGGCDTLSLDYMQMFSASVQFGVYINGVLRHTIIGTAAQNVVMNTGELSIQQPGAFTLKIAQLTSANGQVAIDNIRWTSFAVSAPEPPVLLLSPTTTNISTEWGSPMPPIVVTATEANGDEVSLRADGLPAGAQFVATNGLAPLIGTFTWTPSQDQIGVHTVTFLASDTHGGTHATVTIEVTPIRPYYYAAYGQSGTNLLVALHDIVSSHARELNGDQENAAMADIHTAPDDTNAIYCIYREINIPKANYNANTDGWNKEHCWAESRGLGSSGPDQVDVHNLYATDTKVNGLRGSLAFDESNPSDSNYRNPATNTAPSCSMDSDSFEPPPRSKGNVARAVFYMAVRYNGSESDTNPLILTNGTTGGQPQMGVLSTLLEWNRSDPPDFWESNRNERIYTSWQYNRNPFVDHPDWADKIWGTDSSPVPTPGLEPDADDDGDGISNADEIAAGSDPESPSSRFEMQPLETDFFRCSELNPNRTYYLDAGTFGSTDILWHAVATSTPATNGLLRFEIPDPPATFYRFRTLAP